MANPPLPPDSDPPPLREAIANRLQARFESFDADGPPMPPMPAQAPAAAPPRPAAAPAPAGQPRSGTLQAQFAHLNNQLVVLREQLDNAFDGIEDHLEDLDARVSLAETRASVAEARASVAETRAADAEARATGAHRRIDELLTILEQVIPRRPLPLEDAPEPGALERLQELTRRAEGG